MMWKSYCIDDSKYYYLVQGIVYDLWLSKEIERKVKYNSYLEMI